LYFDPHSRAQVAKWMLDEAGVDYEIVPTLIREKAHKKPEYLKVNPRHKVPAITDGELALYESAAIVEYLDEQYSSGKKLFPGNTKQRAVVRRLVREADEYVAHVQERLVDQVLFTPQDKWDAGEIASARTALGKELGTFEGYLSGNFLAGEFSAADITLYPMIALCLRMEKKKPDLDVRSAVGPKIGAWMKRIEALPYFDKTYPPHWKAKT